MVAKKNESSNEEPKREEKPVESVPPPENLVGSGQAQLLVRASVGVLGIRAGETRSVDATEEVRANIASGNLSIVR